MNVVSQMVDLHETENKLEATLRQDKELCELVLAYAAFHKEELRIKQQKSQKRKEIVIYLKQFINDHFTPTEGWHNLSNQLIYRSLSLIIPFDDKELYLDFNPQDKHLRLVVRPKKTKKMKKQCEECQYKKEKE
jgi:hypothetical protein